MIHPPSNLKALFHLGKGQYGTANDDDCEHCQSMTLNQLSAHVFGLSIAVRWLGACRVADLLKTLVAHPAGSFVVQISTASVICVVLACACSQPTPNSNGWVRDNGQWVNLAAKYYNIDLCLHSRRRRVCSGKYLAIFNSISNAPGKKPNRWTRCVPVRANGRFWMRFHLLHSSFLMVSRKTWANKAERANSHKDKQCALNNNRLAMAQTHTLIVCIG